MKELNQLDEEKIKNCYVKYEDFTFYIMILRPTALQVDRPLLKQQ